MAEYNNNTDKVVFYYIDSNTYGHLVPNQLLATNKEFTILESIDELNLLIEEPYIIEDFNIIENGISDLEKRKLYEYEVVRLIRLIYNQDEENAIQRKYLLDKETNEEEFLEYHNYVEQCKIACKQ